MGDYSGHWLIGDFCENWLIRDIFVFLIVDHIFNYYLVVTGKINFLDFIRLFLGEYVSFLYIVRGRELRIVA